MVKMVSLFFIIMNIVTSVVPCVCVCVCEQDAGYEGVMRMPKILMEASPLPVLVLYVSGSKDLAGGEWGVTQWRGQDIMRWGG